MQEQREEQTLPSAQCVGGEFVKQYYTLLNQAPDVMHRFYSHDSSFVHGGIEKPGDEMPAVMGQMEIHNKIMSLDFKDCHAKIRQVDSQRTLGNGVLIQVSGELSNNGQLMRRFMQTFVLGLQSPNHYYVHNDIFRYQDEVFYDDDSVYGVTDGNGGVSESAPSVLEYGQLQGDIEENHDETLVLSTVDAVPLPVKTDHSKEDVGPNGTTMTELPKSATPDPPHNAKTPSSHHPPGSLPVSSLESAKASPPSPSLSTPQFPAQTGFQPAKTGSTSVPGNSSSASRPSQDTHSRLQVTSSKASDPVKPMSWAERAAVPSGTSPNKPQATVKPEVQPEGNLAPPSSGGPLPQRSQSNVHTTTPSFDREGSHAGSESSEQLQQPMRKRYPDNQQLFVGNLPHSLNEMHMKEFFQTYGPVLDVRINRKNPNRDVPNFGFVTFESTESVQSVLGSRPIFLDNGHRLNVEEKKQQPERPGSGLHGTASREIDGGGGRGGVYRGRRGGGGYGGGGRGSWRGSHARIPPPFAGNAVPRTNGDDRDEPPGVVADGASGDKN